MDANDASRIVIDESRAMLQIVADTSSSSLLLMNIYKAQKHYNYLQSIIKERVFIKVIKMPS